MKDEILAPFRFRHACKRFETNRVLPETELETILEAGRLAPSAFGLEHWKFVAVRDRNVIRALEGACFDQPQVGNASAVVVILARVADLAPDSGHIARQVAQMSEADRVWMGEYYADFARATDLAAWSIAQCMIAAAQMMIAAAMLHVDSCPLGGFDAAAVKKAIGNAEDGCRVALVLPLGYRAEIPRDWHRLPFDEIVTCI